MEALSKLLHDKVVMDLQEGGEGPLSGDPRPEIGVAVTEPAENVEDQDTVLHGPAEVAKRVRHALHLAVELADGEVALDEGVEARVEPQSPGFSVAQELALECQPSPASARSVADEVVEVQGDRPQNPGEDDAIEAQPRGGRDHTRGVEEDVVIEGVAAEGEEDQVLPASVGGRLGLEDDRDEEADVLDSPGLVVELRHERIGRIVPEDNGVSHAGTGRRGVSHVGTGRGRGSDVGRSRDAEDLRRLGDLASQGVGRIALALPGDGGLTHAGHALRNGGPDSVDGGNAVEVGSRRRGGEAQERVVGAGQHPQPDGHGGNSPCSHGCRPYGRGQGVDTG